MHPDQILIQAKQDWGKELLPPQAGDGGNGFW